MATDSGRRPSGARSESSVHATDIVGRGFEQRALEQTLARIPTEAGAAVIRGPGGMGKSTLLEHAVEFGRSLGLNVVRCGPSATESGLSYSALGDLIGVHLQRLSPELPRPQAHALAVALREADADELRADQHSVLAGFRSLMTLLIAEAPTVIVVDDAQWLDPASSAALEFTLRRMPPASLGILMAERSGPSSRLLTTLRSAFEHDTVTVLELEPLTLDEMHRVLDVRLDWVPTHPLLSRIVSLTDGNPFYALQISRSLQAGTPEPSVTQTRIRLPTDLAESLGQQVDAFPPLTRRALLLAALEARPRLDLVSDALADDSAAAFAPAELEGVVTIDRATQRINFAHSLMASAVIERAPTSERLAAHRALARVDEDPEESARHLALASGTPGSGLAEALERAAHSALHRGAPAAAIEFAELSIQATRGDDMARNRRRFLLTDALVVAGEYHYARTELLALRTSTEAETRHRACLVLARITSRTGQPAAAVALAEEAITAAATKPAEAAARIELALLSSHDPVRGLSEAERAVALIEQFPEEDRSLLARARFAVMDCAASLGRPLNRDLAMQVPDPSSEASEARVIDRIGYRVGNVLLTYDETAWTRRVLERALTVADEEGDEGSRPTILDQLSQLEVVAGRWPSAREYAGWQRDGAQRAGQLKVVCAAEETLASIDVREGRFLAAEEHLQRSTSLRAGFADSWEDAYVCRTRGLLRMLQGDVVGAVDAFARVQTICAESGVRSPGVLRYEGDQIEALVLAGDLDEASILADSLSERAAAAGMTATQAAAERGRGLVLAARGSLDLARACAQRSVEHARTVEAPLELGRSLLALGQLHRRRREKKLAADALTEAITLFDRLDARPWAVWARTDLQRLGLRPSAADHLTATEAQVARLAASGLTNPEIGARLSMSRKTVEFHLTKVFRKLDVRRRAELPDRLARTDPVSGTAAHVPGRF